MDEEERYAVYAVYAVYYVYSFYAELLCTLFALLNESHGFDTCTICDLCCALLFIVQLKL